MSTLTALRLALLACIVLSLAVAGMALSSQRDSTRTIGLALAASIIVTSGFSLGSLILQETP